MNRRSYLLLYLLYLSACSSFSFPFGFTSKANPTYHDDVQRYQAALPTLVLTCLLVMRPVSDCMAAENIASVTSSTGALQWTNDYQDPLHPLCRRHIDLIDERHFRYTGTAVGPIDDPVLRGCTSQEIRQFGLRRGSFEGTISDDGRHISAGDGIHEGVWEPAGTAITHLGFEDKDGIRWNDGNKWVVQPKSPVKAVGEVIFWSYLGFSTLAGGKGLWDGIQRKWSEASSQ